MSYFLDTIKGYIYKMDDSASQIFFRTRSGYNLTLKHIIMMVTAGCCLLVAIIGIVMISKGHNADKYINQAVSNQEPGCPDGTYKVLNRCFKFMLENQTTWSQSREICKASGGDLAVLDDCYLLQRLIGYIHSNTLEANEGFWVGATDQGNEGVWNWLTGTRVPMGAPFWGTELKVSFKLEPAGKTGQNCLQLYGPDAYTFHDGTCSDAKTSICETAMYEGNCPPAYKEIRGMCFQFVTRSLSWNSAKRNCQSLGGELAFLKDCYIFADVINRLKSEGLKSSMRSVWLGGNDESYENIWTWTDGTTMMLGAPFWGKDQIGPEEPNGGSNQNCAAMLKHDRYFLHDVDCFKSTGFSPLCEFQSIVK